MWCYIWLSIILNGSYFANFLLHNIATVKDYKVVKVVQEKQWRCLEDITSKVTLSCMYDYHNLTCYREHALITS